MGWYHRSGFLGAFSGDTMAIAGNPSGLSNRETCRKQTWGVALAPVRARRSDGVG
jgi:hypothetical protein